MKNSLLKRLLCFVFILTGIMMLVLGCGKKEKHIVIGVIEPLSGTSASSGELELRGIQIANLMRFEALGQTVELKTLDIKSDTSTIEESTTEFIKEYKPVALIGCYGSKSTAEVIKAIEGRKLVLIAPTSTSDTLTGADPYFFRMMYTDSAQAKELAYFAVEQLEGKKVGIMVEENSEYSLELANAFEKVFMALSASADAIVERVFYTADAEDFNAQITAVAQADPDIIFVPGKAKDAAKLITQARQLGVYQPFLGADTWDSAAFLSADTETFGDNVYFTSLDYSDTKDTERETKFATDYNQKYSQLPTLPSQLGFDAYNLLLDAIESAGSVKGADIKDYLMTEQDFIGTTGKVAFDPNGDAVRSVKIKTVKNGVFEDVTLTY